MRDWHSVLYRSTTKKIDIRQDVISHLQNNYSPVNIDYDPLEDGSQSTSYPTKVGAFDFFDPMEGVVNLVVMRDPKSGALFALESEYIEEANTKKGQCKIVSPYSADDVLQIQRM